MQTLQFSISDMACNACVETITKAVQSVDAEARLEADVKTKQVTIATTAEPDQVKEAIATAGYNIVT